MHSSGDALDSGQTLGETGGKGRGPDGDTKDGRQDSCKRGLGLGRSASSKELASLLALSVEQGEIGGCGRRVAAGNDGAGDTKSKNGEAWDGERSPIIIPRKYSPECG